ncbi:serpin-ZX-like [Pyrus ussuriensis x Pyrus communis]|uniref:Serpin-ZX-like n=1 Tax=Pyrus ussuriensis x Pyrus communis TaxID=2448454 RepID=A0A5N5I8C8_9ROSA|nr:serpin-ZX-like [Pyrus ussuriensis x Pyrus communis]
MDPKEASNLTDVALKITSHLLMTEGKEKNIVYSPLSIQVALWLLTAGSKGPTQDQLLCFLKSDSTEQLHSLASHLVPLIFADGSNRGGPRLCFANSLWVKDSLPIEPSFKEVVDTVYKAAIRHVSFKNPEEVRHQVNLWAEKETKGHITEALPPMSVNKYTMLIFSNALYFKGADKFNARETKEDNFHLFNGTSAKAPFMTSSKNQFVEEFDGFKVLKLFYEQGKDMKRQFSMYLLLPDSRDGLPALVERVCSEPGFLDSHRPPDTSQSCDLTEMVEASPDECKIYHKSFIEVNEKGTEAAAVSTAVVRGFGCKSRRPLRPKNIDFVADHPFMLFIKEEMTETVLFTGHVLNPLEK